MPLSDELSPNGETFAVIIVLGCERTFGNFAEKIGDCMLKHFQCLQESQNQRKIKALLLDSYLSLMAYLKDGSVYEMSKRERERERALKSNQEKNIQ